MLFTAFFETEDLIGFIWIYGYFINKHNFNTDYGTGYGFYYIGAVFTPMICLCSSFGVRKWSIYQIGDVIFSLIGLAWNNFHFNSIGTSNSWSKINSNKHRILLYSTYIYHNFYSLDDLQ